MERSIKDPLNIQFFINMFFLTTVQLLDLAVTVQSVSVSLEKEHVCSPELRTCSAISLSCFISKHSFFRRLVLSFVCNNVYNVDKEGWYAFYNVKMVWWSTPKPKSEEIKRPIRKTIFRICFEKNNMHNTYALEWNLNADGNRVDGNSNYKDFLCVSSAYNGVDGTRVCVNSVARFEEIYRINDINIRLWVWIADSVSDLTILEIIGDFLCWGPYFFKSIFIEFLNDYLHTLFLSSFSNSSKEGSSARWCRRTIPIAFDAAMRADARPSFASRKTLSGAGRCSLLVTRVDFVKMLVSWNNFTNFAVVGSSFPQDSLTSLIAA